MKELIVGRISEIAGDSPLVRAINELLLLVQTGTWEDAELVEKRAEELKIYIDMKYTENSETVIQKIVQLFEEVIHD